MEVHVTGGSGFLGGHLVPLLVARGDAVTALVRSRQAAERVAELGALPIMGDLDEPASVDEAFAASGASALVNLASLGFGHASTIVAAAEEAGLQRAVFVSTTAIFTHLDAASRSVRLDAERAIRESSLEWTILRPSMIYGTPGDRNMVRLLRLVRRSPVIPVPGGGRGLQQPVHVDDVASAIVAALDQPAAAGRAYEIAGPEPMTLDDVIDQVAAAVGRRPARIPVPLAPAVAAFRLYERAARRPRLRAEQLARLGEDKAFDIAAARRDLAYAPRSFAEGIAQEATALRDAKLPSGVKSEEPTDSAKKRVLTYWEAEACGERYGVDQDRARYELEPMIPRFADFRSASGGRVLEIGVGMGADFVRWLRAGAIATGVDLTSRAVALTRKRATAEGFVANLLVADAEALPFARGSFDLVYSWGVLHHTPSTGQAIREARRVLAPRGRLKLMLYHRRSWVALAAWLRFGPLGGHPFTTVREALRNVESPGTQAFTRDEMVEMLHGLVDVTVRPVLTRWDRRVAPLVSSLLGDRFGWFLLIDAHKAVPAMQTRDVLAVTEARASRPRT